MTSVSRASGTVWRVLRDVGPQAEGMSCLGYGASVVLQRVRIAMSPVLIVALVLH